MKNVKIVLILFLIAIIVLTGCQSEPVKESNVDLSFKFEVTDNNGEIQSWDISTNKTTVGEALREEGIIEEEGLINTVNGLTVDWDTDNAYWAFYINGEMSMTGVDDTPTEDGVTYAFIYTAS